MIIYHGSTDIVKTPIIIQANKGRDFGSGFYATNIQDQATKWAKRQALYRKKNDAILNIYEFDDSAFKELRIKSFEDYSMDWLEFVVGCRRDAAFSHEYDLIIGKIANDDVGETIQAVLDGLTPKDFALSKLVFMYANNQICFSTEKSLNYLKFVLAERVK